MYCVDISTFLSLCMTGYRYKPGNLSIRIAGTARLIHLTVSHTVDTHLIDHKLLKTLTMMDAHVKDEQSFI